MKQRAKSRQVPGESKKDWILRLWGELPEPTTREVSEIVGCRPEYVRVVIRQRKGTGTSEHDRAYLERKAQELGAPVSTVRYQSMSTKERRKHNVACWVSQKKKLAADPQYHAKRKAYQAQWHRDNRSKERL
jgi:hypothetical protein